MLILHILVSFLFVSRDYDMLWCIGLFLIIDFSNQFNHIYLLHYHFPRNFSIEHNDFQSTRAGQL